MFGLIARDWWVYAVRGVAAVLFGILALAWPAPTLYVLVLMFGAYALVDGTVLLIALARGDVLARRHAWATGLMGALGIVAAVVTFLWPGITALTLLYLVAIWAITVGILQVFAAIEFRREIEGELWVGLGGVLSIVFGAILAFFPGTGLLSLVWLVGFWAIVYGVSSLSLAYRLHGINSTLSRAAQSV